MFPPNRWCQCAMGLRWLRVRGQWVRGQEVGQRFQLPICAAIIEVFHTFRWPHFRPLQHLVFYFSGPSSCVPWPSSFNFLFIFQLFSPLCRSVCFGLAHQKKIIQHAGWLYRHYVRSFAAAFQSRKVNFLIRVTSKTNQLVKLSEQSFRCFLLSSKPCCIFNFLAMFWPQFTRAAALVACELLKE